MDEAHGELLEGGELVDLQDPVAPVRSTLPEEVARFGVVVQLVSVDVVNPQNDVLSQVSDPVEMMVDFSISDLELQIELSGGRHQFTSGCSE